MIMSKLEVIRDAIDDFLINTENRRKDICIIVSQDTADELIETAKKAFNLIETNFEIAGIATVFGVEARVRDYLDPDVNFVVVSKMDAERMDDEYYAFSDVEPMF